MPWFLLMLSMHSEVEIATGVNNALNVVPEDGCIHGWPTLIDLNGDGIYYHWEDSDGDGFGQCKDDNGVALWSFPLLHQEFEVHHADYIRWAPRAQLNWPAMALGPVEYFMLPYNQPFLVYELNIQTGNFELGWGYNIAGDCDDTDPSIHPWNPVDYPSDGVDKGCTPLEE